MSIDFYRTGTISTYPNGDTKDQLVIMVRDGEVILHFLKWKDSPRRVKLVCEERLNPEYTHDLALTLEQAACEADANKRNALDCVREKFKEKE